MKVKTLDGQIYVTARAHVYAHRSHDPFFAHGHGFESPAVVALSSGLFAVGLNWVLDDGVLYVYHLGNYATFDDAAAVVIAFYNRELLAFPMNYAGEYYNGYLRSPVVGKYTGEEWYNYTATH
jgi:hypothetical protein